MPDNTIINATTAAGGVTFRDVDKAGLKAQVVVLDIGGAGAESLLTGALPVTGTFFQATQPVSGTVTATGPVTDTQLRATAVPVSGTFFQATQPVSLAVAPVTPVTDNAGSLTVDAPVGTPVFVRLSDGAAAIATLPVSAASLPLPTGASTETTLAALNTKVTAVNTGAVVLAAGVANIGDVDVLTLPPLVAGTAIIGALVANQSTNTVQLGGVAITVGSGVVGTGVQRAVLATDVIQPALSEARAATLHVTATAAVNTAITATLPAPAAGLFHYITSVELTKLYAVLGVAAAAGVVITSTNLPGTPAWTTEQAAGALGTAPVVINYKPTTPLRCAVAATATTFVAPAQTQTIWRWNISYFTGP